jgi:hypothetical protein
MAAKRRKSAKRTAKRRSSKRSTRKTKKPIKFLVKMYNKMPANHAKLGRLIKSRGGKIGTTGKATA